LLTEQESGVIPFQAARALGQLGITSEDKILESAFNVWEKRNRKPLVLELKKVIKGEWLRK